MKIYMASPFFCTWDNIVRNRMIKKVKQTYPNAKIFYPDRTIWSKLYSVFHSTRLAKRIYREDTEQLYDSDTIIFPEYTSDLGTLFEVGCAMGRNKVLLRYNYFLDTIEECDTSIKQNIEGLYDKVGTEVVLDCSKPKMAVVCGYLVSLGRWCFKYSLPPTWADNIMFKYSGIEREIKDGVKYNTDVL